MIGMVFIKFDYVPYTYILNGHLDTPNFMWVRATRCIKKSCLSKLFIVKSNLLSMICAV